MRNHANEIAFGGAGLLLGMGGLLGGADLSASQVTTAETQAQVVALQAKVADLEIRLRREETISRVLLREKAYGTPACNQPYYFDKSGIRRVRAGCAQPSQDTVPEITPGTAHVADEPQLLQAAPARLMPGSPGVEQ